MAKQLPIPVFDTLVHQVGPLVEDLRAALRLPDELERKFVLGRNAPPCNLLRLVGTLPASESWHDAGPNGHIEHSLRVATRAARLHRERFPEPAGDGDDRRQWLRRHLGVYLSGLCHDLGKILFIDVTCAGHHWPVGRYLCDWAAEVLQEAKPSPTSIDITYRPRTRSGPEGHEPLALYLLPRVLPTGLLSYIGFRDANDIIASLSFTLGARTVGDAYALVHEADQACTGEDRDRKRSVIARPPADRQPYIPGSASLADDFVHGFRALVTEGVRLRFNTLDAQVMIGDTHTVLWITAQSSRAHWVSPFHQVYNAMRDHVRKEGLAGYVQSFYGTGNPFAYLDELSSRSTRDGEPWCVHHAGETSGKESIRHRIIAVEEGGKRRTGYGVIFHNVALWGHLDPAKHGTYSGRMAFLDERKSPSCDPEDVGFLAYTAEVPRSGGSSHAKLASLLPSPARDGVLELETVVAGLVRELAVVVPSIGTSEQQHQWHELVSEADERIRPSAVLPALEACLDRVRHWRVRGGAVSPGAAETRSTMTRAGSSPTSASPSATRHDLAALVAGLIQVVRRAPVQPLQEPFHAWRAANGTVVLPWPQALDGILDVASVASLRDCGEQVASELGIELAAMRIPGLAYNATRNTHFVLTVPAAWMPIGPVPEVILEPIVLGSG